MYSLPDERVVEIAKSVATANNVSFTSILAEPAIDSNWSRSDRDQDCPYSRLLELDHGPTVGANGRRSNS